MSILKLKHWASLPPDSKTKETFCGVNNSALFRPKCSRFFFFFMYCTDLSAAKRKFAQSLNEYKFQCIGDAETDDEMCIGEQLGHWRRPVRSEWHSVPQNPPPCSAILQRFEPHSSTGNPAKNGGLPGSTRVLVHWLLVDLQADACQINSN